MSTKQSSQTKASDEPNVVNQAADAAAPRRAAPRASGGGGKDAPPSNTASKSYGDDGKDRITVLRKGLDSLYLSYQGEITESVEQALLEAKQLAQSRRREDLAQAQYIVKGHLFEVKPGRQGLFPYVLEDGSYRISLSSGESRKLPFAYCKISSDLLAHKLPDIAEEELAAILDELAGQFELFPTVSRVDLFVDFQTTADIGAFHRDSWVTRAGGVDAYSRQGHFSGWVIGAGGPISSRLYDKTLEIHQKRHKAYLLDLWRLAGMNTNLPVWRLEFQLRREVLEQLAVRSFAGLLRDQGGIWQYATQEWLRLTTPLENDQNRGRWPTHPLWEQLGQIRWRLDDVPLKRQYTPARVPTKERLFRMFAALLTSFMAAQGITSYREGLQAFQGECDAFHRQRCAEKFNTTLEEWIELETRTKGRLYNTLRNLPSHREEADRTDEVTRYGIAYNKAARGE